VFFLTTSTYPASKAQEMIGKFQKAMGSPLPTYMKRLHTLSCPCESGLKVVGLYEVTDDRMADAYKELARYFSQYYDVEGFRYTVEPMMNAQEAIPLVIRR
jgi:hypothetical protein